MPNPLTGDFEAVVQVSGSTVNHLLATMHANAGNEQGLPTLPHRAFVRIGDDALGGAIDGVRGATRAQIAAPTVELIGGSQGQFTLECWIRARYVPDPDTTPCRSSSTAGCGRRSRCRSSTIPFS